MKRFLLILLAASFLMLCGTAPAEEDQANEVDFYLPSDPDTATWEYTVENEDLIDVTTEFYPDIRELGLIGNSGADWFHVSGLEPGTTTLRFLSINSQTLETDLTLVYRLKVDEDLNVIIWGAEMLEAERSPRGAITSFFFTSGGYNPPESYTLRRDEDGNLLKEVNDDGEEPAPEELLEELADLAEQCDVLSWNGFNGASEGALDGENFLFAMVWENGFSIQATGSNAFPENYFDFRDALGDLFGATE